MLQTNVELQALYQYSFFPILIIILLLIGIIYYIVYKKILRKEADIFIEQIPKKVINNNSVIKGRFLSELDSIEKRYDNNDIELREAYQLISEQIRLFVFEMTGKKAQNFSLKEIQKNNMPAIYRLIKEYYRPEFASKSIGDFKVSINKARSVIKKWY